ncbi:MAG: alpha/beta fold hydrolase [Anaerolineae bacterium]
MKQVMKSIFDGVLWVLVLLVIAVSVWAGYVNFQVNSIESVNRLSTPGELLTINDYNIHVQTFGDLTQGTPVLLLHGFDPTGSLHLTELAQNLSAEHPVILPDMLGFGFSERVLTPGTHYTHAGRARTMVALLDALGVEQVYLIGHSYGGAVAGQLALDYPQRVRRIVFMSANIYPQGFNIFRALGSLPAGFGRAVTFSAVGGGSADYSHEDSNCINCSINPRNQYVLIPNTTDALLAINRTPQESRVATDIGTLSMPVAVIWGQDDMIVPVRYGERLIAETQPEEVAILGASGHEPYSDNLSEVLESLRAFLP